MIISKKSFEALKIMDTAIAVECGIEEPAYGRPLYHVKNLDIKLSDCGTLENCIREVRRAFSAATGTKLNRVPERRLLNFSLALYRDMSRPKEYYGEWDSMDNV